MAEKENIFKTGWNWFGHASQAWQIFFILAPSGVLTAVTAASAYFSSLPLYSIILIAVAVFCFASLALAGIYHFLLKRLQLSQLTAVAGKLDFVNPHIVTDAIWDAKGKAKHFRRMNVGVQLRNNASFPVDWKFVSFSAVSENIAPPHDPNFVGQIRTVVSHSVTASFPGAIDVERLKKSDVKVRLDFEIAYGKEGGELKYSISKKLDIDLTIDKSTSQKPQLNVGMAPRDRM